MPANAGKEQRIFAPATAGKDAVFPGPRTGHRSNPEIGSALAKASRTK
jgi:hypothetical protein